jgi:integrase
VPRLVSGLTATKVRNARPGRYADGHGLYLFVRSAEARFWVLRYRVRGGKSREMGLGRAGFGSGAVTLADARQKAVQAYALVKSGVDPLDERQRAESITDVAREVAAKGNITFAEAAADYIAANAAGWRNPKHASQWPNTLRDYVYPVIGKLPVSVVETSHVTKILKPIWTTKPETASRIRGRIETILDFSKVHGWRDGENPARWRGHLENVLPKRSKVARVEHHAALPWRQIGAFMAKLAEQDGISSEALKFTILTACRTNEAVRARWDEVDLDIGVWTIPGNRMKAGREHRVPLSPAVVTALNALPRTDGWVFPGGRHGTAMSNMAMAMLLRRMNREDLTVHGFRSTFRDWVAEATQYPGEVAEAALAHVIGNKVEAAYRRGDLFEKRRQLMDEWALYCLKPH